MFILDNLLAAPIKGMFWIFEEIAQAAEEETIADIEMTKAALVDLYHELESGQIDEAAFEAREQALLDHLDSLETS
ncbi:gas vesicle protein GvpG [Burkholderia oklahomensis]|uniref:gas vesicle protein GvpG n=1 Tax=Burkholderia oklahomensis TaxID=342113 RepID=UPI00016A71C6|nr:gas vesicle protein GvpG [Burkholderia oklahomensis]AJX35684.1 gas vesicle G family protein [Burkholderia oklahomensis C6786]AOI48465.1 hypothetical protein WI23_21585 [Burkholderia oklahomensis C6786]KUY52273.1 hypothetical protein WI23_25125 [Burkholderia oklahomensis C6786]MBI0363377.1 gas vesicle protein GvpG [Burkholderia oklahomensis]SUY27496.1 Gas vesicle protein G [Burkholderia oklahomensis]